MNQNYVNREWKEKENLYFDAIKQEKPDQEINKIQEDILNLRGLLERAGYYYNFDVHNWILETTYLESKLEFLAEQVHITWMKEKLEQGFHAPTDCPQNTLLDRPDVRDFWKNVTYCDKCHSDLYPYEELPENIKEYDRVTVRNVLNAIKKLGD